MKDYINTCQICGKQFITHIVNENTCSAECKKKRKAKQDKEYHERHKEEILPKLKQYRDSHQEYMKQYRAGHKAQARITGRIYSREKQHHYCIKGEESKVENYAQALAEDFEGWCRHHRLETHTPEGQVREVPLTSRQLKQMGLYYDRPASELIWMRREEHRKLHKRFIRKS